MQAAFHDDNENVKNIGAALLLRIANMGDILDQSQIDGLCSLARYSDSAILRDVAENFEVKQWGVGSGHVIGFSGMAAETRLLFFQYYGLSRSASFKSFDAPDFIPHLVEAALSDDDDAVRSFVPCGASKFVSA